LSGVPLSCLFFWKGTVMGEVVSGIAPSGANDGSRNTVRNGKVHLGELIIVIKGAGEMATGIAHGLYQAGMKKIIMTEIPEPLSVRRFVSFCEAVYEGAMEVERVRALRIESADEAESVWARERIAVFVDPRCLCAETLHPHVLIDARMVKRERTVMRSGGASFTIGVGPGFRVPDHVDAVIESNRGHNLGRVIYDGEAEPYTGIPGAMMGHTAERVLRSPVAGRVKHVRHLGDAVNKGDVVLKVNSTPLYAAIDGILRGLIREIHVADNEKVGDIDPRAQTEYCRTISEKARAIGGGVLQAIMHRFN